MSEQVAEMKAPPGSELLKRLQMMEGQPTRAYTEMLLLSVGVLPLSTATDEFWQDFEKTLLDYKERYHAALYELSPADRAFLIKITEANQVRIISDLKVEILRLIQTYFPENFGMVDQSRLLQVLDLRFKLSAAIRGLEKLEARPGRTGDKSLKLHPLEQEDIIKVNRVYKELGTSGFAKVFIHGQKIAMVHPGQPPAEVMREYFIGMGALKKHVFDEVELRGSGNLFNQLTLTLDRVVLNCFGDVNPSREKCSVNLNVETVFTPAFQKFMGHGDDDSFTNIAFEFRQANILQHFDEYEVASELIRSKGGTISVDAIFPDAVGVVNMARLNANMAKIFWRPGAENVLPKFKKEIEDIQKAGTLLVIARLDDEAGMKLGQELGITMYQGFHIDDLMDKG